MWEVLALRCWRGMQLAAERATKELNAVSERNSRLARELADQAHANTQLEAENKHKAMRLHLQVSLTPLYL